MGCIYSEMYSAVTAEVPIVSDPSTQVDPRFIDALKKAEKVLKYRPHLSMKLHVSDSLVYE
jgi:hypothetical protein